MAKFVPKIVDPLLNFVPNPTVEEITQYASKALRAKIAIYDRNFRGFVKTDVNGPREAYEHGNNNQWDDTKAYREQVSPGYSDGKGTQIDTTGHTHTPSVGNPTNSRAGLFDYIKILDIDFKDNLEANKDKKTYSYLTLPFVPRELDYRPESTFVGIASFGRNNPFYQFTGSEDTLTFTIDWFSAKLSREDVIFNCRWLESLTKGDGYEDVPHRVKIIWSQDDKLFEDSIWLLVSAPYRLTQFVKGYELDGETVRTGMLPQQAVQTVTFKKLKQYNSTTKEIVGNIGR